MFPLSDILIMSEHDSSSSEEMYALSARKNSLMFSYFMDSISGEPSENGYHAGTSLPVFLSRDEAARWLRKTHWESIWIIRKTNTTVGTVIFYPTEITSDVEGYENHIEVDIYLHPLFRGSRTAENAVKVALHAAITAGDVTAETKLLAEIWLWNIAAMKAAENAGWRHVGNTMWESPERTGMCARYEITAKEMLA